MSLFTDHATLKPPLPVVLVVDDDPLLRMLAVDIADEAGFGTIEAQNADEAVAILEARSDIALVLTDVDMPGSMDGLELAHAVRHRWPPIRIIVVSGQMQLSQADLPSDSLFFGKPYHTETLISEFRSLIGRQENPTV
jgi:CheY-like chemotaxis protein